MRKHGHCFGGIDSGAFLLVVMVIILILGAVYVMSMEKPQVSGSVDAHQKPQVNHEPFLREMMAGDEAMFRRGQAVYKVNCLPCHGSNGQLNLNQSRKFGVDPFLNTLHGKGGHPVSLFSTLSDGFKTMPPQRHLSVFDRYAVIHYVREQFLRPRQSAEYVPITDDLINQFSIKQVKQLHSDSAGKQ